jgi:16S rRNA processing protein RimM
MPSPERLVVGLVRGIQGLRGTVRVEILSDRPERFEPGSVLFREGDATPLTVTWQSADGPGLLLRFKEIHDRDQAAALHDVFLEAEVAADALAEDAVWWHELVGVDVLTTDGEAIGRVEDVFRSGGGEILVVTGGRRGEILVPDVAGIVVDFSPRDGRIVVDPEAMGLEAERARRPRGRRSSRAATARPAEGSAEAIDALTSSQAAQTDDRSSQADG